MLNYNVHKPGRELNSDPYSVVVLIIQFSLRYQLPGVYLLGLSSAIIISKFSPNFFDQYNYK